MCGRKQTSLKTREQNRRQVLKSMGKHDVMGRKQKQGRKQHKFKSECIASRPRKTPRNGEEKQTKQFQSDENEGLGKRNTSKLKKTAEKKRNHSENKKAQATPSPHNHPQDHPYDRTHELLILSTCLLVLLIK